MSLLLSESFDGVSTLTQLIGSGGGHKWRQDHRAQDGRPGMGGTPNLTGISLDASGGRTDNALKLSLSASGGTGGFYGRHIPKTTELIIGLAMKVDSGPRFSQQSVWRVYETGQNVGTVANWLSLEFTFLTRTLIVWVNGIGTILTANQELPSNEWVFVEVKFGFGTSVPAEMRFNEIVVASTVSANTKGNARDGFDSFVLLSQGVNAPTGNALNWSFDDLYICDGEGDVNNDYLGDVSVFVTRPIADSTPNEWSNPSLSPDNYAQIDEASTNDSDYIHSHVTGDQDFHEYSDIVLPSPIVAGTILHTRVAPTGPDRDIIPISKIGVDEDVRSKMGMRLFPPQPYLDVFETAPSGSSWDQASLDAMTYGFETADLVSPLLDSLNYASIAAAAASITVTAPSGIAEGELLIAHFARRVTYQTITPPAGWTLLLTEDNLSNNEARIYYKIATASEPSSYTWSFSPNQQGVKIVIYKFSRTHLTTPIDTYAVLKGNGTTGDSAVAPGVSPSSSYPSILRLYSWNNASQSQSGTATPTGTVTMHNVTGTGSGATEVNAIGFYQRSVRPEDAVQTAQLSTTHLWIGITIALKPVPSL